ncbi:MAG: PIN domain nuclease [Clostridiales bacterium]|nr:PIN domain nuclease [Clostridiales bacterium]
MRKQKVYIDTSVISHLQAADVPDKERDTQLLWAEFGFDRFEPVISEVTFSELVQCVEPKSSYMFDRVAEIKYLFAEETAEAVELSKEYLKYQVLSTKHHVDLRQIAIATVNQCDYIVSWNFNHFVNINVINRVNAVNRLNGYGEVLILPPTMLLGLED